MPPLFPHFSGPGSFPFPYQLLCGTQVAPYNLPRCLQVVLPSSALWGVTLRMTNQNKYHISVLCMAARDSWRKQPSPGRTKAEGYLLH